jgi:tRNA (guanine37-N1)-methyltransferase
MPLDELNKVYSSFDVVGDLAIIKHNNAQNPEDIAKQILLIQKNVKAVFTPATRIAGDFRVRELKLLAGESRTKTTHRESGCTFKVDIEKCYFSPRLSYEHMRIANLVDPGEVVVNMFAGIGCFSIIIAKKKQQNKVYSIDVNPIAFEYMQQNVKNNFVYDKVVPLLGDAKDIIESKLHGLADRVLMPLPEKALEYLPIALSALKRSGGFIHFYDFQHVADTEDPREKTKKKVAEKLSNIGMQYVFVNSRIIRPTGPNWYQTVVDIQVDGLPSKF